MDNYGKLALGLSTAEAIWLTYLTYEKVMKDRKDEKFDLAVTENLQRHEKLLESMLAQLNQLNTKLAAFEHFRQQLGKMQDQLAELQDEADENRKDYKEFDPGYVMAQLSNILRDADKAQMPIERAPASKKKSRHSKSRRPRRKTTPPPSSSESSDSSSASSSSSSEEEERRHSKSKGGKSSRHSKSRHSRSRKDASDSESEGYDTSADVARVRAANAATSSSSRSGSRRH